MKATSAGIVVCGLFFASLVVGCGESTNIPLAKVPPVTPTAPEKVAPFPKNAVHSPAVLPGSEQK